MKRCGIYGLEDTPNLLEVTSVEVDLGSDRTASAARDVWRIGVALAVQPVDQSREPQLGVCNLAENAAG